MGEPSRILLIRPSALGDVCKSVPALASLRRAYPDAAIDWLVQDTFADAVRFHPALTDVVAFPRAELSAELRSWRTARLRAWAGELRARKYDLVVDVQGLARSGLVAWATGAPRRVGFVDARELGWLGLTERHAVPAGLHSVDRMMELIRLAGVEPVMRMGLHAPPAAIQEVRADARLTDGYVLVAPTSRWPGKRWPADRFAALAAELLRRIGAVVVVGTASERPQCRELIELADRDPRVVDRIGGTSVGQLMALVKGASLVVANDSAALHMGVGFDRPLVALYGPTDVRAVGPYRREADVIQHLRPGDRFEHKDERLGRAMMDRITIDEVVAACQARLTVTTG